MDNKIFSMIGLAKRAGKISTGEFICKTQIKKGVAKLIILAENASDNTKKSIINSCNYYKTEYYVFADMADLGKYTGGGQRAVISVNDVNLANGIKKLLNER